MKQSKLKGNINCPLYLSVFNHNIKRKESMFLGFYKYHTSIIMDKAWIITESKFPTNDAVTLRIEMLSYLYQSCGYEVTVLSRTPKKDGCYHGIMYKSLRGKSEYKLMLICNYILTMTYKIFRMIKTKKPRIIVVYNSHSLLLVLLIKFKNIFNYTLYHDSVEWYSKEQFKKPFFSRLYIERELWMRYLLPKNVNITAISKYLENYFKSTNTSCFYLPAVCDTTDINYSYTANDKIVLIYAGSPGKKDYFAEIIEALRLLSNEERSRILFKIVGATKEDIAANASIPVNIINSLESCIECFGRVSREEVYNNLLTADFSVLLRSDKFRYAIAGFPTKVPESIASGTPIFCNITSDLGLYLKNGYNSIIIDECSTLSVYKGLQSILALSIEDREKMKIAARKTAERFFDYRVYTDGMSHFLKKTISQI